MIRQALAIVMLCLSLAGGSVESLVDQTSLGGSLYLVNRTYRLTSHYQPDDLVRPDVRRASSEVMMRREAAGKLEEMFEAAAREGMRLVAVSGFRSYETQRIIYQRKIKSAGSVAKAELLVAPPGASEHQLGLAMDVGRRSNTNLNMSFGRSKEGEWVARHAHEYGFILRYQDRWTDITGYANEPWHIRYVGVEHAAVIYAMDIPLETYVDHMLQMMFGEVYANLTQ
jgi:D-alanyl-D-alanine carboxypeptidase